MLPVLLVQLAQQERRAPQDLLGPQVLVGIRSRRFGRSILPTLTPTIQLSVLLLRRLRLATRSS